MNSVTNYTVKLNNLNLAPARMTNHWNKLPTEAMDTPLQPRLDSFLEMGLAKCKLLGQEELLLGYTEVKLPDQMSVLTSGSMYLFSFFKVV